MKENKLKIGDKVKVIDTGNFYTTYHDMAEKMDLEHWVKGKTLPEGTFATVIAMEDHCTFEDDTVIGIKTSNNDQFMIGSRGLELIDESIDESEEDQVIKISRKTLNYYYENATESQRTYINNNFKIDGTTTVKALIGLEELACSAWKSVIRNNHPEYFSEVFNFSTYAEKYGSHIFTPEEYEALGFDESPIQIRNFGEYKHKGFYLTYRNNVKWEIKEESCEGQVLIPIFK